MRGDETGHSIPYRELSERLNRPYHQEGSWYWLSAARLGIASSTKIGPFVVRPQLEPFRRGKGMLPVLLSKVTHPVARGCARVRDGGEGLRHPPHPRDAQHRRCRLHEPGRILHCLPIAFEQDLLNEQSYLCREPNPQIVQAVVAECEDAHN